MKPILVGVDGSFESTAAAAFAAELAGRTDAKLVLAFVAETTHLPAPGLGRRERDYGAALLRREAARFQHPGLQLQTIFRTGSAPEELADLAAELDAALVVVGHRGRGNVQRLLIGSVADRLMQMSPRPVLVHRSARE